MRILGIDPGTATVGYGVIESAHPSELPKVLGYGCILTDKKDPAEKRLAVINRDLRHLIRKYKPHTAAVEKIFFYKNQKTAIAVAQARGVILLTLAQEKIVVAELTPLQVKQTITNFGRAEKKQVQYMVKQLLGLKVIPKPDDAADALALALCAQAISPKGLRVKR
jgi:crossover junction endodeoxyribonuclease RuvC